MFTLPKPDSEGKQVLVLENLVLPYVRSPSTGGGWSDAWR
jgi:hypothetical protein